MDEGFEGCWEQCWCTFGIICTTHLHAGWPDFGALGRLWADFAQPKVAIAANSAQQIQANGRNLLSKPPEFADPWPKFDRQPLASSLHTMARRIFETF